MGLGKFECVHKTNSLEGIVGASQFKILMLDVH